ncbi:MAG: hypothetical protein ACRDLF_07865 [Solirubrobacteraceae bacterium]
MLRALEDFARPDDATREDQVVYVTHSPFLINKNAAQRLRVLDKGSNEEGTRVVRDVARNHYEPLRSSIGGFVAETAFVGGTNLLVEGLSDQVLLAGVATMLRHRGIAPRDLLDLNQVAIVPAGSASGVPYMAYLARGRDELKPPCVALLDGDPAGREAARRLAHSTDGTRKPILDRDYVVDLSDWATQTELKLANGVVPAEIEDLLSPPTAASRDAADGVLRELEASLEGTIGDDAVLADISSLRREFELGSDPLSTVPECQGFRERVKDLKTRRRLAYQPPEKSPRPSKVANAPSVEEVDSKPVEKTAAESGASPAAV